MKIVHFAPFAPNACGLYEAARDMIRADMHSRHDVYLVDTGIHTDGKQQPGKIGAIDKRGDKAITTSHPDTVFDADVIVAHTGVSDNWLVKCTAPIVWIIHGRPAACFRPEQNGGRKAYSLIAELAKWPRVAKMVHFWDYHTPFWEPIIPENKLVCLDAPPIDERRFAPEGKVKDYGVMGGKVNVMIAESWREDIDIYEIAHGALMAADMVAGMKVHMYAMETPLGCWSHIIDAFRQKDIKGELYGRIPQIEQHYRAADILLSPQRIMTRSIGEALSCGTPVIAGIGNYDATWTCDTANPRETADMISYATVEMQHRPEDVKERVDEARSRLSLSAYSMKMNRIYEEITS